MFPTFTGAGSPQGVQVGSVGNYYKDTTDGLLYAKVSGMATNTGWLGPLFISAGGDLFQSDADTAIPADGAQHAIDTTVAAPPAWADGTGAIILPGLYQVTTVLHAGVAATTPGQWGSCDRGGGPGIFPVDVLAFQSGVTFQQTIALIAGDTPYSRNGRVKLQADATTTVLARMVFNRLAFNAP